MPSARSDAEFDDDTADGELLMPATVIEEPLGISCVFSDGRTARFHLDGLPCRELVRDLLVGLVELIHPHGSMDAAGSVDRTTRSPSATSPGHLAARGSPAAQRICAGPADRVLDGRRRVRWEACTRRMLRGFETAAGRLDAGVRGTGRRAGLQPPAATHPAAALHRGRVGPADHAPAARSSMTPTRAHKQGLAAAERGRHRRERRWTGTICLAAGAARAGRHARRSAQHLGCSRMWCSKRGGVPRRERADCSPTWTW